MHDAAIHILSRLIRMVTSRIDEGYRSTMTSERSIGYARNGFGEQEKHRRSDMKNRRTNKELAN